MRYNVYLQTITYVRKFFTNHEKNCTKNVHIIFLHLAPHRLRHKLQDKHIDFFVLESSTVH